MRGPAVAFATMERAFDVRGRGVRLAVRAWDGTGPGVLLLHGLASSSHIWDLVAPRLRGLPVVAFDQRGHGRSSKPSSGYGFERVAADAAAVIGATHLRPAVVVGHSWGANVALEVAARHRRLVRGLVLVDGGFVTLRDHIDWPTTRERLAPPELKGTPLQEFLEMLRYTLRGQVEITPEVETVFRSLMRVDRDGNIHPRLSRSNHLRILRALWEQDTLGVLRRTRVPTLVLAARSDRAIGDAAIPPEEKDRAAEEVRTIGEPVRFRWIRGIHDVPLQRPTAVASGISRFLGELVG
jgi:pimeloyl-ACP methyl ester carboxylesterase